MNELKDEIEIKIRKEDNKTFKENVKFIETFK